MAKGITAENLKQVCIDEKQVIRTIKSDALDYDIKQIYFKDKEGSEIAKIYANKNNEGQELLLEEGEEIIGIYGHKNSYKCFYNLGFIVW